MINEGHHLSFHRYQGGLSNKVYVIATGYDSKKYTKH